jgi:hypothetical protein
MGEMASLLHRQPAGSSCAQAFREGVEHKKKPLADKPSPIGDRAIGTAALLIVTRLWVHPRVWLGRSWQILSQAAACI